MSNGQGSVAYKARKGAPFGDNDAQVYGECIAEIMKERGSVRPDDVVDVAQDDSSPLHSYFEWDDAVAGAKHRKHQARLLMNGIVKVRVIKQEVQEHRAFVSVSISTEKRRSVRRYVTIEEALTNSEYRQQMLESAMRELKYWRQKYDQYHELSIVFNVIDEMEV